MEREERMEREEAMEERTLRERRENGEEADALSCPTVFRQPAHRSVL